MMFIKWFGWSVLWTLPLLLRSVFALLTRKPVLGGRGAIRIWLGTGMALLGSTTVEAFLRAQFNTADEAGDATSGLLGAALLDGLSASLGRGLGVLLMLLVAVLGLVWLLGALFGRARPHDEEGAELDLAPPRRGSIESERNRMSMLRFPTQGNTSGAGRDPSRPRPNLPRAAQATSAAAATPPSARQDWQVPLSSLQRKSTTRTAAPAQAAAGSPRPTGWPAARQTAPDTPARPESEWAAFESLRPTDAMLARAAASNAISAASQAAHTSLSRAAPPSAPPVHVPPSIARQPAVPTDTRGIRISNIGRATPHTPQATPETRADVVPTRLMRALQEAAGQESAPPSPTALPLPQMSAEAADAAGSPMQREMPADVAPPPLAPSVTPASAPVPPAPVAPIAPTATAFDTPAVPITPPAPPLPQNRSFFPSAEPMPWEPTPAWAPALSPAPEEDALSDDASPAAAPLAAPVAASADGFIDDAPHVDIPLPALDLLDEVADAAVEVDAEQLAETGRLIEQRLKEFKVPVAVLGAEAGPVITRFEVEPAQGVRGAQVVNLMKDLSRALGLTSIRVVETIPGKTCMGLELPNARRQMIKLSEIVRAEPYRKSASLLTLAMGKDITGNPVVTDLARAPHMLVAGTTGSGKSVAINAMILSLLYKATPDEVRMIMIDPKMLELSIYEGIPHLLAPVVTDMREAAHALNWAVEEMERRYKKMSRLGVRNLAGYNQKIDDAAARGEKIPNPFSLTPDAPEPLDKLPTIVIIIDELADLMMVVGKKVEELIARLAQKARAAGIHLILATQRPSVDVITGLIKANIPTRVAFQVSSKIDSRTVLDQMGAESLLGHGDMLFLPPGSGYPQRVHGAFVSDEEVHRVVEYLKSFGEPQYIEEILAPPMGDDAQGDMFGNDTPDPESDPLYDEAVAFVLKSRRASISSVQRQFRIGYNRAARLVEQMETAGVLSAMSRNGSRDILVPPSTSDD